MMLSIIFKIAIFVEIIVEMAHRETASYMWAYDVQNLQVDKMNRSDKRWERWDG